MNCKFCNGLLDEDSLVCPACGKDNAQELPEEVEVTEEMITEEVTEEVTEEAAEEAAEESGMEETAEGLLDETAAQSAESAQEPKKKTWIRATAIICSIVVVLGLAVGIWCSVNGGFLPKQNDIHFKASYSKSTEAVIKAADVVVARVGNKELTNGQLQIQYWMQISQFLNTYSSYLSAFGMDTTKPLSQQMMMDQDITWEQYFIQSALASWHQSQSLALSAEEDGYQMSEDAKKYLAQLPASFEEAAVAYGFATSQEFVSAIMDPSCTLEEYLACMELDCMAADYLPNKVGQSTQDEVTKYFDENATTFLQQYGVSKDSGKLIDVRHILITPKGGTVGEDGKTVYTDEEWETCRVQAQKILDQWRAGEATEESFAQLAYEYSEDGNYGNGGLYTDVYQGQMVETFNNWCFNPSRKAGNTGLVMSPYGYHVMYFVEGEEAWYRYAEQALLQEKGNELAQQLIQKYSMDINYRKISVAEVVLSK